MIGSRRRSSAKAIGPGPPMTEKRKLAAILAADVVGFSRLTGTDEEGTLARLRTLWSDLIDPNIAVHNGRVERPSWGDSRPFWKLST
jgi:class 3 adenylate cyclase